MPDTTHQINICGSTVLNTTVFPDTVLQTLDRRVGKDDLFFDKEMFSRSVEDWSGIPVIFQPDGIHPTDFKAVEEDPKEAAKAVGGHLVGFVSNPRIVIPGGARLMAELDIDTDDGLITELWQQGKIFPSTAFTANSDGDRLVSPPVPNHVLLFPAKTDVVVPGDPGAFVNTYEVSNNMTKKENDKKTCNSSEEMVDGAAQPELPVGIDTAVGELEEEVQDKSRDVAELAREIEALKTEIAALKMAIEEFSARNSEPAALAVNPLAEITNPETAEQRAVAELTAENEVLKAELELLKKELEDQKAMTAELGAMLTEAKFSRILDRMPPGSKATEAQVNSMRKAFEEGDVEAILNTAFAARNQSGATKAEGVPFTQSSKTVEPAEGVGDLSRPHKRA